MNVREMEQVKQVLKMRYSPSFAANQYSRLAPYIQMKTFQSCLKARTGTNVRLAVEMER
jgi:hypothetical protein